ncbi:MAG: hypothetical protein K9L78_03265 [Victivallales bacterium]|nr:hypothetical protein [Victivallales bacterium]MCF7889118.1 hypothetical protein [Victivallales bacterium]
MPFGTFTRADRWSYIPSAFIWLGVAFILTEVINKILNKTKHLFLIKLIYIVLILYLLFLTVINIKYQQKWKSYQNLFRYSVKNKRPNRYALITAARIELKDGNYNKVLQLSKKFISLNKFPQTEESIVCNKIAYNYFSTTVLYYKGYYKKALSQFLYLEPMMNEKTFGDAKIYYNYLAMTANCYYLLGVKRKAVNYINKILKSKQLKPFRKYFYSGVKEGYLGNYKNAILFFKKALKIHPDDLIIIHNIKKYNQLIKNRKNKKILN